MPWTCKYSPVTTITNAVETPTIQVSTNGCNIAIKACATGLLVLTAAKAVGAVPNPASFANIARLNPHNIQPKSPPPTIAWGWKACTIITFIAWGMLWIFKSEITKILVRYKAHIRGVTFSVNLPIDFIPPIIVIQVTIATIKPISQLLFAKILLAPPVTSVIWVVIALIWNKFQPPITAKTEHKA